MEDARRLAPATARNREPILNVLRDVLPARGLVLEIAAGSGEHAVHFARALPDLTWQPSDPAPEALASIAAWRETEALGNLLPPLQIDAAAAAWPISRADALVCINMIHISPWDATQGLMRGAGRLLGPGSPLALYGPYLRAGHPLATSNEAFDEDLRARNPRWGLRALDAVVAEAEACGMILEAVTDMPANNLMVVLRRR